MYRVGISGARWYGSGGFGRCVGVGAGFVATDDAVRRIGCVPDGWGLLLMDRLFRQHGLRHPGPLDRLAFIGERAMGALRFVPASDAGAHEPDWSLLALAEQSRLALAGEAGAALRELALTGGSPQGARPKALVQYDATTGQVSTRPDAPCSPWLVKFPAQNEHKEVCVIQQLK